MPVFQSTYPRNKIIIPNLLTSSEKGLEKKTFPCYWKNLVSVNHNMYSFHHIPTMEEEIESFSRFPKCTACLTHGTKFDNFSIFLNCCDHFKAHGIYSISLVADSSLPTGIMLLEHCTCTVFKCTDESEGQHAQIQANSLYLSPLYSTSPKAYTGCLCPDQHSITLLSPHDSCQSCTKLQCGSFK